MTRESYVYDKKTKQLVPKDEYYRTSQTAGFFVVSDIEPYQSMITGEIIQGRRQHREHLRQHNCIEVGNEKMSRPKKQESTHEIKRMVADIISTRGY